MLTYIYCLLTATLAARTRHCLLSLSLEEAIRWMILRGYSPFAEEEENARGFGYSGHQSPFPKGVPFPLDMIEAVTALSVMEAPNKGTRINHGSTRVEGKQMTSHHEGWDIAIRNNRVLVTYDYYDGVRLCRETFLLKGASLKHIRGCHTAPLLTGAPVRNIKVGQVLWMEADTPNGVVRAEVRLDNAEYLIQKLHMEEGSYFVELEKEGKVTRRVAVL